MSLRLNGRASPTRSGSSSDAKVSPPLARESPSLFTAIFLMEHPLPPADKARRNKIGQAPEPIREFLAGLRLARNLLVPMSILLSSIAVSLAQPQLSADASPRFAKRLVAR